MIIDEFVITLTLFMLGAAFGSFLGVLTDRLPVGLPIVFGRSICLVCKKQLKTKDLIPLISFLWLNGKCRYCKSKIPPHVFFVEMLTALSFAGVYLFLKSTYFDISLFIFLLIIICCFIVILLTDFMVGIIPDEMVIAIAGASLVYHAIYNTAQLPVYILSSAGSFLVFLLLVILTKGKGMGFGDVKLALALGLLLGFPNIISALYIAFLTGAAVSIILILRGKKKLRGSTIPFGPFMIIGALAALFFANYIDQFIYQLMLGGMFSLF